MPRACARTPTGRVVSDNVFGEMWEDAARRDFTINAMYYDPTTQQVYDYHGGFEDLKKRRLVMIGDPVERYREDPVRIDACVRIAAKLGFTMDRDTERAIPKMARTLENVPAARLFDEMMKLFTSGHAEACLIKLRARGVAPVATADARCHSRRARGREVSHARPAA